MKNESEVKFESKFVETSPEKEKVCFVLFCFVLFCFVLFCFVLFCFVLFCFVLFCFVLFCCFVVLLFCCFVVLLFCCFVVLLFCCFVVLLFCCFVVLLFCCFVLFLALRLLYCLFLSNSRSSSYQNNNNRVHLITKSGSADQTLFSTFLEPKITLILQNLFSRISEK